MIIIKASYKVKSTFIFTYIMSVFAICFSNSRFFGGAGQYNSSSMELLIHGVIISAIIINILLFIYQSHLNICSISLVIIAILLGIASIVFKSKTVTPTWLMIYLIIVNARLVTPNMLAKTDFLFRSFCILIILSFHFLGVFPNNDVKIIRDGSLRYSLGFIAPNEFAAEILALFFSFILFILSKKYMNKNIRSLYFSIFIIICLFVYKLTLSRGFIYSISIMTILLVFRKHIYYVLKHSCIIVALSILLTIYTVFILNPSSQLFQSINRLMSSRLDFLSRAVSLYSLNLFGYGNKLIKTIPLDNLYIYLLLSAGLLGFILYIIFVFISTHTAIKYHNWVLCILIIGMIVFILTENVPDLYFPLAFSSTLLNRCNQ